MTLSQRSLRHVWHPCTQMKQHEMYPLLALTRGEGVWLYANEQRYLDAISSWWVNLFGHNHPHIKARIIAQLHTLEHAMLAGFTHEPVVELSERLAKLTGLLHAFYASDGASATEIALKMSVHYWRTQGLTDKTQFISLSKSYHGETLGALAVSDIALFKQHYQTLLIASHQVPSPDWRLAETGETAAAYAQRAALSLQSFIEEHHTRIAALIIEPLVQCAAGMAMYHPLYLQHARQLCNEYDILLVADEIAVGFGRTGSLFAYEQAQIQPDLLCLSKGISGGYLPLAVVMSSHSIFQAFYTNDIQQGFLHSHSYSGNPLACSAALAVLDIFEQEDVLANNQLTAQYLAQALTHVQDSLSDMSIQYARQQGMILAFDVLSHTPQFAQRCYQAGLQEGVLLRPIANTVYWMPPYTITSSEIDFLAQATIHAVRNSI